MNHREALDGRHLTAFFLTTFSITWGLGGLYFLFPEELVRITGPIGVNNPLFMLATYAPAIAAVAVVASARGRVGLGSWLRNRIRFRVHWGWYAVVVGGIAASLFAARLVAQASGVSFAPWPPAGWGGLAIVLVASLWRDPGGIEELGWRGFALPLLQRRMSALAASATLGFLWGIWHLPAFFIAGAPQEQFGLAGFVFGSMVISVLMTAVFNGTGGSIPLAFLFHWANNDPLGFDKPLLALHWVGILLVIAGFVVWRLGARNLGSARYVDPLSSETAA